MGKIIRNGISYAGSGGGGNANIVELTKAEYDALPDTKLTDGKLYMITDIGGGDLGGGSSAVEIEILDSLAEIKANTEEDKVAGALAVKELAEDVAELDDQIKISVSVGTTYAGVRSEAISTSATEKARLHGYISSSTGNPVMSYDHYPSGSSTEEDFMRMYFDGTNFYAQGKKDGEAVKSITLDNKNLTRYYVPDAATASGLAASLQYIFRTYFSDKTSGYYSFKFPMNWYSSSTSTSSGQALVEGAIFSGRATGVTRARSNMDTYSFYCDVTEGGADAVIKKLGSPTVLKYTATSQTGSFNAGGTVLFAGISKCSLKAMTYETSYGHEATTSASCTYSGKTISWSMGYDSPQWSGQEFKYLEIIYAIE